MSNLNLLNVAVEHGATVELGEIESQELVSGSRGERLVVVHGTEDTDEYVFYRNTYQGNEIELELPDYVEVLGAIPVSRATAVVGLIPREEYHEEGE